MELVGQCVGLYGLRLGVENVNAQTCRTVVRVRVALSRQA